MKRRFFRWMMGWFVLVLLAGALWPRDQGMPVQAAPAGQLPVQVVISEFRTRGPSGGNDEFVELFNPTTTDVNIGGWLIKGSNNAGSTSTRATIPVGTVLLAGQHYLVANTSLGGYSGSTPPDLTYSTGFTDDGGIALTLSDGSTIIDQVGMSTGSAYKEGSPLAPLTANEDKSYQRPPGGNWGACLDTDDNASDFSLASPSNPRSSSTIVPTVCQPTPTAVGTRDVVINEIAWGGTKADGISGQWIELYNPGSLSISLNGWRLVAIDGTTEIPLSGNIAPGGYYLIEPQENVTNQPANLIYPFTPLNPLGNRIVLYSSTDDIVDTANNNGGPWPAGTRFDPYASMERGAVGGTVLVDSDENWLTFNGIPSYAVDRTGNVIHGTPGQANWASTVTATPSPTATFTNTPTPTRSATPTPTSYSGLKIVINEVAWAGTRANADHEWIELYNPNTADVNLNGWYLISSDGSPWFSLNGIIIAAGEYLLLVRDANTFYPGSLDSGVRQIQYSGALSNDGEILRLLAPDGTIVDTANEDGSVAWPAGANTTYRPTMERRTGQPDGPAAWITNTGVVKNGKDKAQNPIYGTPGRANWAAGVTPTPSKTPTLTRTPTVTRTPTRVPYRTPTPVPRLVLNEFVPRPGQDWNNDGKVDVFDEYIEIYNAGITNINLSGWELDDEADQGSEPYTLPGRTLKPGEYAVYYASTTGISLSDGGDTVRLLKPNGDVADAYTYGVVKYANQTWCRQPDGYIRWIDSCAPSPGRPNTRGATPTPVLYKPWQAQPTPACLLPDTVPETIAITECGAAGLGIWRLTFWDRGEGELWLDTGRWLWPALFK